MTTTSQATITGDADGSLTIPAADVEAVRSALLWARLGADNLAETCTRLADADFLSPDTRDTQLRNAAFHAERSRTLADLETRVAAAYYRATSA